ncbi:hypothetical protein IWW50_005297 [Coemansia erecta]|nr:hypothetical protein GGF43_005008 [Coemansia sp. RSA 2618]KAJ2819867.1 hypothetical protein IWW50_005297 [Coemansia erecta]
MLKLKQMFSWCIRHKPVVQRRTRIFGRRTDTESIESFQQARFSHDSVMSARHSSSSETLVDEKHRGRAFSDPEITEIQHEYSYYPWTESEHEEILRRSPPPPSRRHYDTFPSLVEMGGFLSL